MMLLGIMLTLSIWLDVLQTKGNIIIWCGVEPSEAAEAKQDLMNPPVAELLICGFFYLNGWFCVASCILCLELIGIFLEVNNVTRSGDSGMFSP